MGMKQLNWDEGKLTSPSAFMYATWSGMFNCEDEEAMMIVICREVSKSRQLIQSVGTLPRLILFLDEMLNLQLREDYCELKI